jgi:hypothetical protein
VCVCVAVVVRTAQSSRYSLFVSVHLKTKRNFIAAFPAFLFVDVPHVFLFYFPVSTLSRSSIETTP